VHHPEPEWTYSKCFPTHQEAADWKADQDEQYRNRDNIGYSKRKELERLRQLKVRDLVRTYIHFVQGKRDTSADDLNGTSDFLTLHAFCGMGIGGIPLAEIKKHHFVKYFDQQRKGTFIRKGWSKEKQRTPRAVARERNVLQRAFQVAIDENFYDVCHVLENPVRGITIEGSMYKKTRTLLPGEEKKLVEAFGFCLGLNKYYAPLAMYLSLETGMRMQEVISLRWNDVDFERRRIRIRKSKTDRKASEKGLSPGRTIVMPFLVMSQLIKLWDHLNNKRKLPWIDESKIEIERPVDHPDSYVFLNRYGKPMTSAALGDVFTDAVKRAGIEPYNDETLTFHCLRRAANISYIEAGMTQEERDVMQGRSNKSMDSVYGDAEKEYFLRPIQDKLDKHVLKKTVKDDRGNSAEVGMTLEEAVEWHCGRKISNLEMLSSGSIPIPIFDRQSRVQLGVFITRAMKEVDDRLSREEVLVYELNKERTEMDYRGYMTKADANKIVPEVAVGSELLRLDPVYGGIFVCGDHLFISESRAAEGLAKYGKMNPYALANKLIAEPRRGALAEYEKTVAAT
jgi:integrase